MHEFPLFADTNAKGGISMSIKLKRLLIIYSLAALLALSGYSYAAAKQLERVRLTAGFEAARAFEAAYFSSSSSSPAPSSRIIHSSRESSFVSASLSISLYFSLFNLYYSYIKTENRPLS
jgi:hypothetical protein